MPTPHSARLEAVAMCGDRIGVGAEPTRSDQPELAQSLLSGRAVASVAATAYLLEPWQLSL